jgi:hypothetical protein
VIAEGSDRILAAIADGKAAAASAASAAASAAAAAAAAAAAPIKVDAAAEEGTAGAARLPLKRLVPPPHCPSQASTAHWHQALKPQPMPPTPPFSLLQARTAKLF